MHGRSLSLPFGLIVCPPCRVWQVGGAKPSLDDVFDLYTGIFVRQEGFFQNLMFL